MRQLLANRTPETSCRNGFIACSLLHSRTDIQRSCWADGVVVLLLMIRTALLWIFGRLWKTTLAERSPTSSLLSQIGHRRGDTLDRFVMFWLQMPMPEVPGEKFTEPGCAAECLHLVLGVGERIQ